MLPGFRFLFTAIVLSTSILVFGLGAAALLRAAHEEFASHPSRRAPPEPVFARLNDDPMPSLALLRIDLPATNASVDNGTAAAVPEIAPDTVAPAETAADERPAGPEKVAALKADEPVQAELANPQAPATEAIAETLLAPEGTETPATNADVKLAVAETPASPAATAPARSDPLPFERNAAATRIATLGGPAVIVDGKTSAGTTDAKPDRSVVRKRAAQRARERRRIARRARLAREAALAAQQQQQQENPFAPVLVRRIQ